MKNDKIIPGTILVLAGVVFLLDNFGVINFHWVNVLHLWPIFLIIGGVNLVFAGNRSVLASIIKIAVVVAGFALLLFGNFSKHYNYWPPAYNIQYNTDDDDDSDSTDTDSAVTKLPGREPFKQGYNPNIKQATLNINGGGTNFILNDTTSQLFNAEGGVLNSKFESSHTSADSSYTLTLQLQHKHGFHIGTIDKDGSAPVKIKLNQNPVWDINVATGASELNFDLSKFKIKNLTLKGGAASFDVKLGTPLHDTNVEVSTGVSEVNIAVPKTAACKITASSGLSSHEYDGFIKQSDNSYETADFNAAKNKIYINMRGGVSDFKVNRY